MPDFPRPPPAEVDPAVIWAYATRTLTGFTGTPRSDLMGEDADFEAGVGARKARIDLVDVAVSTRSSHVAADIWGVATRELTGITGTPRTNLLGEDADFEAGTGARKARIDRLDIIEAFDTPIEGTHTPSALNTEEDVILDEPVGDPLRYLEGFIDLTNMAAGDTVVLREYLSLVTPVSYVQYAEETYSDAQALPALYVRTKPGRYGIRVSLEQTAGTIKDFPFQFFRKRVV